MSVLNLYKQFEEIRQAKGKEKQIVIAKFKDDELFKEVVQFVYSPYFTTGIAKKKMQKDLGAEPYGYTQTILQMFEHVKKNNSGSDTIVRTVQCWILNQPPETHQFLREVFTQDMQIGATSSTFNKVIGENFIKEHNIQLAKTYADDRDKFTTGEYCINLKIDGYRATIKSHEDGTIEILSKGGLPFEGLSELTEQLKQLPDGWVYDGELLWNDFSMKSDDQFRKTGSALKKKGEKTNIMFMLFDLLPISEFETGESKLTYRHRLAEMRYLMSRIDHLNLIQLVPIYYIGDDHSQIAKYMKVVEDKGYEGLMLNDLNSTYKGERHVGIMKVKQFRTADLRITGYREYKHPNNLGAFKVDFHGNEAWIGGGYSKPQRAEFWANREDYIGKIIEVEYFQESNNQNGGEGIRHGNFVRVRWDKNDVSYN
jgi:DNA ligase-1